MEGQKFRNILLISGAGRNSGKTTFACAVIRKFSRLFPLVAIKISPHLHENIAGVKPLFTGTNYMIAEENDALLPKDSSRMLAAGARKSLFIMAHDEQLPVAWQKTQTLLAPDDMVVCESGGLRNLIVPGLFLIINHSGNKDQKRISLKYKKVCDYLITFDGMQFNFPLDSLDICDNQWIIS